MFIERKRDAEALLHLIEQFPITLLTGPRQCGKTTLARSIEPNRYFFLSDPGDAEQFVDFCKPSLFDPAPNVANIVSGCSG